jgi:hypothetical protein
MLLPRLVATTMQTRALCSGKQPAQRRTMSLSKKLPSRLAPAKVRAASVHLSHRGALRVGINGTSRD